MVVVGIVLLLIGWLAEVRVLLWLGILVLIAGLVLNVAGTAAPYGRRWY